MLNKRGQTWSFDLIVAVVLFAVVIGLFYGFMTKDKTNPSENKLQQETEVLVYSFDCNNKDTEEICFLEDGVINEDKLITIYEKDYDELKSQLKIDGEFCVYIRDLKGNLIPINNLTGFGSSDLTLTASGLKCSEMIIEPEVE
ncbi:MAG: hypothetical protein AB7V77_01580 [Candidatus Woesearchaeota archaeon]